MTKFLLIPYNNLEPYWIYIKRKKDGSHELQKFNDILGGKVKTIYTQTNDIYAYVNSQLKGSEFINHRAINCLNPSEFIYGHAILFILDKDGNESDIPDYLQQYILEKAI